jgi:hypothetical protein
MISRREFVVGSLAASAAALAGCRDREQVNGASPAPQGSAKLTLHFAGGTAFKHGQGTLRAIQLSGLDANGDEFTHPHHPHAMRHRSFIVFPAGTVTGATPFDAGYRTHLLNKMITPAHRWEPVCLVGRDVHIETTSGSPFSYACDKVAHYGSCAAEWKSSWNWETGPLGKAVNSRFKVSSGVLKEALDPHNQEGAKAKWKIGIGAYNPLSDIATLIVEADTITISGIGSSSISLTGASQLEGFVFAGPDHRMGNEGDPHEYDRINHALLLHTIYAIPDDQDIRPVAEKKVVDRFGPALEHPCDLGQQVIRTMAPPDSEYCVNYDELP